jgi:hypothetical protein
MNMKATVNGMTLEGSPQEIMEFLKLQEDKAKSVRNTQEIAQRYYEKFQAPYIDTSGSGVNIYRCPEWMKTEIICMN